MKKIFLIGLILLAITGCTSRTSFGECIGLGDEKDPTLIYKVSGLNVAMAIIGFELIFPPVLVVVDQFYCPTGKR